MDFPVSKKLVNEKAWYRIEGEQSFTEWSVTGTTLLVHHISCRILPERVLLQDLLSNEGGRWVDVSPEEFHEFLRRFGQLHTSDC